MGEWYGKVGQSCHYRWQSGKRCAYMIVKWSEFVYSLGRERGNVYPSPMFIAFSGKTWHC